MTEPDIEQRTPPLRAKWRVVKAELLREIVIGHIGMAAQDFRQIATVLYPKGAFDPIVTGDGPGADPAGDNYHLARVQLAEEEGARQAGFHPGYSEVLQP